VGAVELILLPYPARPAPLKPYLFNLCVDPAYRRRGIGQKLVVRGLCLLRAFVSRVPVGSRSSVILRCLAVYCHATIKGDGAVRGDACCSWLVPLSRLCAVMLFVSLMCLACVRILRKPQQRRPSPVCVNKKNEKNRFSPQFFVTQDSDNLIAVVAAFSRFVPARGVLVFVLSFCIFLKIRFSGMGVK
jgi:hypothetical protein